LDVSCIVLAGGKSSRLGRNKVVERIGDSSLLERVLSRLSPLSHEMLVVIGKDSSLPQLTIPGLKIIRDIFPGKGSLGGVYSGLVSSGSFYNFVVACDMPFLNIDLLGYMLTQTECADVIIPRLENNILEPLHAIYSKNCIDKMELLINQNRLSILELFPMVKVRYIEGSEIKKFDPENLSFFNVNTEKDLRKGQELAAKEELKRD
jgi:molybdopterin-guanine dinucleotide biosynthesis protein A